MFAVRVGQAVGTVDVVTDQLKFAGIQLRVGWEHNNLGGGVWVIVSQNGLLVTTIDTGQGGYLPPPEPVFRKPRSGPRVER